MINYLYVQNFEFREISRCGLLFFKMNGEICAIKMRNSSIHFFLVLFLLYLKSDVFEKQQLGRHKQFWEL